MTTISARELSRARRAKVREWGGDPGWGGLDGSPAWRPQTRGDCARVERPCPYVGCRHHLYLDVTTKGAIRVRTPHRAWEMPDSCSLDVAEDGPKSLDQTASILGLTGEMVRRLEKDAMTTIRPYVEDDDNGRPLANVPQKPASELSDAFDALGFSGKEKTCLVNLLSE